MLPLPWIPHPYRPRSFITVYITAKYSISTFYKMCYLFRKPYFKLYQRKIRLDKSQSFKETKKRQKVSDSVVFVRCLFWRIIYITQSIHETLHNQRAWLFSGLFQAYNRLKDKLWITCKRTVIMKSLHAFYMILSDKAEQCVRMSRQLVQKELWSSLFMMRWVQEADASTHTERDFLVMKLKQRGGNSEIWILNKLQNSLSKYVVK